jgi:hypothetical protein
MVAGCGADPASQPGAQAAGETVSCGPVGETLLPVCTVEREAGEGGALLILHHPDGGFRRLRLQGNTISAADGADVAAVTHLANGVEVAIGGMRYRLAGDTATAGP